MWTWKVSKVFWNKANDLLFFLCAFLLLLCISHISSDDTGELCPGKPIKYLFVLMFKLQNLLSHIMSNNPIDDFLLNDGPKQNCLVHICKYLSVDDLMALSNSSRHKNLFMEFLNDRVNFATKTFDFTHNNYDWEKVFQYLGPRMQKVKNSFLIPISFECNLFRCFLHIAGKCFYRRIQEVSAIYCWILCAGQVGWPHSTWHDRFMSQRFAWRWIDGSILAMCESFGKINADQ